MSKRNEKIKSKTTKSAIISAIVYIVLGLIMIFWPVKVSTALCYVLGTALTVYGIFNLITFFRNKNSSFGIELIVGIIATAFGIFFLISPQSILGMIALIIGVLIIVDSTIDIKRAYQLKMLGVKHWWISLVISIAVIIFGAVTIICPAFFGGVIMIVLGATLVYEGVSALILIIMLGKYAKKADEFTVIDVEAEDVD